MALIFQYAIELKDIIEERFGAHLSVTDNCAGQFFSLDKPMTEEFKSFLTEYLFERKQAPIFWDAKSFSVKNINYGGKRDVHSINID